MKNILKPLLLFLAISIGCLHPLLLHFDTHVPLHAELESFKEGDGDPWVFIWNFYHLQRVLSGISDLYHTSLIFYPEGASLTHHTLSLTNSAAAQFFLPFLSYIETYNLLLLLQTVFCGWAAFLLSLETVKNRNISAWIGVVVILAPARLIHSTEHLNVISLGPALLTLALLFRAFRKKSLSYFLLFGVMFSLTGLSCWYHLLSVAIALPFVLFILLRQYPENLKRMTLLHLAAALLLSILLLTPFVLPMSADASVAPRSLKEMQKFSADLLSFIIPSADHFIWGRFTQNFHAQFAGNPIENTHFLGFITILLFFFAIIRQPVKTWPYALIALSFLILSLGPVPHLLGSPCESFPLPYSALSHLPLLNHARAPGRFSIFCITFLALTAGIGLAQEKKIMRSPLSSALLIGIALLEFLPAPIHLASPPAILSSQQNRNTLEESPHLDIPSDWKIRIYQYEQIFHRKPLLFGFAARIPSCAFTIYEKFPVLERLIDPGKKLPELLSSREFADLIELMNIHTITVRLNYLDEPTDAKLLESALLNRYLLQDSAAYLPERIRFVLEKKRNNIEDNLDFRYYLFRGWLGREFWSNEHPEVFWSNGAHSMIAFYSDNSGASYRLNMQLMAHPAIGNNLKAKCLLNGRPLQTVDVPPEWTNFSFALSNENLVQGPNKLMIHWSLFLKKGEARNEIRAVAGAFSATHFSLRERFPSSQTEIKQFNEELLQ